MQPANASKNRTTVRSTGVLRFARAALQAAYGLSDELGASLAERMFTSPRRHRRPDRERAVLATGRPFTVDVPLSAPLWAGQRARVAAWRWGFGPTVLLVHGWEGRGSQLGAFVEPLVEAGLSVVAFDAPAHGDSPGSRLYLTDHADAVAAVAAAAGPLHATVAHSFGAAAVLLAHARGDLDVARNVMVSPNALIDQAVGSFVQLAGLDADERAAFLAQLAARTGYDLDALAIDRLAGPRDGRLLVIHDCDDPEIPLAHGTRLAAAWPHARLRTTTGLGHRRILRDDAVIVEVVSFLREGILPPASDLVREVDRYLATCAARA